MATASIDSPAAKTLFAECVRESYHRFASGRTVAEVRQFLATQGLTPARSDAVLRKVATERAMEGLAQGIGATELVRQLSATFGVTLRAARNYVQDARRELSKFFRDNQDSLRAHVAAIYLRVVQDKKANSSSKVKAADGLARLWGLNKEKPAGGVNIDAGSLIAEIVAIAEGKLKTPVVGVDAVDALFNSLPAPVPGGIVPTEG